MPVYDQVKQALQDILAPELQALKAELKRFDERLELLEKHMDERMISLEKRMDERLESTKVELLAEIRGVESRIDAVDTRIEALDTKIEGLRHEVRTVLEIRERLAALEAKVGITRP
ncbi:MAG: hypothetical protein ACP5JD_06115 [Candidatus Bipolaricaulaceae bacterium]